MGASKARFPKAHAPRFWSGPGSSGGRGPRAAPCLVPSCKAAAVSCVQMRRLDEVGADGGVDFSCLAPSRQECPR